MRFVFPLDGDCINENDGRLTGGGIELEAIVEAEENADVYIGGVRASFGDGAWRARVVISARRTLLRAENGQSGESCAIELLRLNEPVGKYRLSSDDNILFLQDLTENRDKYSSIFDNPYLAVYKEAHDRYGAKLHLNLFYEFLPDDRYYSLPRKYFDLSMMTDAFKSEFEANSDWLKLAFHARSEFPDRPYRNAGAEEVRRDYEMTVSEIRRFAGESVLADTATVHWGDMSREAVRELRALGLRALTGYFRLSPKGVPRVSYYFDGEELEHIGSRDFWYDASTDMIFAQIDTVLNEKSRDEVIAELSAITEDPRRGGFISMMIHEQYFYDDYRRHLPDFKVRVLDACALLAERGYRGEHIGRLVYDVITE